MNDMTSPIGFTAAHRRAIGPYALVRRLGEGGMGVVYLAHDADGRRVAVKVMRPELAAQPEFRARFRREAEAAKRVARFCTAPVLDVGQDGELLYLVTEFVDGPDLSAVVDAQGPLTGSSLEALAVGVATALAAIHRAQVVHRDLKPSNILLAPVGPRVIDFGIAQLADALAPQTQAAIGTPSYMAPEQARGEAVTAAADVFAWGCVVAYAGTGRPPFGTGAAPEVLYRVVHHAPVLDGLDERLRPLVERALDKDPTRRPSAQELLDRLLGREEVAVEAATRLVSDIWTAADPAAAAGPYGSPAAPRRRSAPVVAAVAAAAVTAAVLLAVLHPWTDGGTPSAAGAGGTAGATAPGPTGIGPTALDPAGIGPTRAGGTADPGGGGRASTPGAGERPTPATSLGAHDIKIGGHVLHVNVESAVRRRRSVVLRWTVTVGEGPGDLWSHDYFGTDTSGVALLDPLTGSRFLPARSGRGCLCTKISGRWYRPGDVLRMYALYTNVPESVDRVDVDFGGTLVPDVPVR